MTNKKTFSKPTTKPPSIKKSILIEKKPQQKKFICPKCQSNKTIILQSKNDKRSPVIKYYIICEACEKDSIIHVRK